MKKMIVLLLLLPLYVLAQEPQRKDPSKGDGQIVVQSNMSFIDVAKSLMAHGYTIDKMDTVLNYLTTIPKNIPTINGEYFLNIMKIGDQYKFTGMYRFNFTASLAGISPAKGAYDVARYTKRLSPERRVFNEAWAAAKSMGVLVAVMK